MITLATYITLFRLFLVMPILWLLVNDCFLEAAVLAVLAASTDILDGYIARTYHQTSELGALLDPIADKFFILSTLTALWYYYLLVPTWLIIFLWIKETVQLFGAFELLVGYGSKPIKARGSGKLALMLQAGYCLLLFFTRYTEITIPLFLRVVEVAVLVVTLVALIDYAYVGYCNVSHKQ